MTHVAIIGAGFGGLTAARTVRRQLPEAEITLISPAKDFIFYPSLVWVPTDLRRGEDLRIPLDSFMDRHRVTHHAGHVTGLRDKGRVVETDTGEVPNDALIIASGGRFIDKPGGTENVHTICKGIESAEAIRRDLHALKRGHLAFGFATNPDEPGAMRGGPMFELLFGIDTWLRRQGRRDNFDITFFCPAPRPGARLGEKAVDGLLKDMHKRGIHAHVGHKLTGFEQGKVGSEGGDFDADLIAFMPGMTGPDWAENTDLPLSAGSMIQGDEYCRVPGFPGVYVVGDAGSFPGPDWMPKQAHQADLHAKAAARNVTRELTGNQADTQYKPELMCIIDTYDKGALVYRGPNRGLVLPTIKPFHWAKQIFEKLYLRGIR